MSEVRYKLAEKSARAAIAALTESAPWYSRPQLAKLMEGLDSRGIEIVVSKAKRKHSDAQRNYYHLGVDLLAKHLGMSHDECHEQILIEHFGSEQIQFMGRAVTLPRGRSAKLPTDAYAELIETLLRVAAWAGVMIPEPQAVA